MFVGSDALALAPLTERIQYLEEGDIAFLDLFFNFAGTDAGVLGVPVMIIPGSLDRAAIDRLS